MDDSLFDNKDGLILIHPNVFNTLSDSLKMGARMSGRVRISEHVPECDKDREPTAWKFDVDALAYSPRFRFIPEQETGTE